MLCRRSMSVARSYCISLQLGCVQKSSKHRTYARRQYLPCHGVRYNQKKNNEKKWKSHGPGASLWEKKPTNNWLWRKKNSPPRESIKKKRCFSSPAEVWCICSFIQRNYILCACILDDSWALFFLSIFIDRTVAPLLCDKMAAQKISIFIGNGNVSRIVSRHRWTHIARVICDAVVATSTAVPTVAHSNIGPGQ